MSRRAHDDEQHDVKPFDCVSRAGSQRLQECRAEASRRHCRRSRDQACVSCRNNASPAKQARSEG